MLRTKVGPLWLTLMFTFDDCAAVAGAAGAAEGMLRTKVSPL
jgi:hypothetical protein